MDQKNTFNNQPTDVSAKKSHKISLSHLREKLFTKPSKKSLTILGGVGLGALLFGVAWVQFLSPKPAEPNPAPVVVSNYIPPEAPKFYSPLTGSQVSEELSKRPVTGVMIENSIDARPQAGLLEAGVVFEAIAEGGITRFLALYQEAQPEHVGPIRSARPYYVRWAAGFDAAYVHSGGSGEALALIRSLGIKDMDHGNYGERIAKRVSNRYSPHNVYSNMTTMDTLRNELGFTQSTFTSFERLVQDPATPLPAPTNPANTITFAISSPLYNTSYTYDAAANNYKRVLAGQPHTDERSGKQITPSVVVALIMPYGIHPDGIHSVYENVGSGKAIVFQNGDTITATWEKPTETASLVIKAADGTPLKLQSGQKWFTAIPESKLSFTP